MHVASLTIIENTDFRSLNLFVRLFMHYMSSLLSNPLCMALGLPLRSEPELAQAILCTLPGRPVSALHGRAATPCRPRVEAQPCCVFRFRPMLESFYTLEKLTLHARETDLDGRALQGHLVHDMFAKSQDRRYQHGRRFLHKAG
jgi:hypothetical protein